ncbi:YdhK family protein [Oceanobacillus massiliensis]|uniref:YdhK family protein n=1 Tax=Oceanobacillus massiliensis TaxID=1465765 RepID=UPI00028A1AE0|nr:YdhK family protein [Oceanobacillus massiliensis]
MTIKKLLIGFISFATIFTLAGCSGDDEETNPSESTDTEMETGQDMASDSHANMDHSSSGEVPSGLQPEENPAYPVGTQAIINADHMKGMDGAEATIAGAYDTTVYTISYSPTTGGEKVENHKWVIHEEIAESGDEPLEPGAEVTVEASHMEGMEDATAVIDSAKDTTVYMVDYIPTTGGKKVTNHKWVTESELSAVK